MPGKYPGSVVRVRAERSIDAATGKVDAAVVREMIAQGMRGLTGAKDARESWHAFFSPADVVGIKVNCSGAPGVMSSPEVVAEIVRNLMDTGVPAKQIWIYERFPEQMDTVRYDKYVPADVHVDGIEKSRGSISGYDPKTYVEVDFFGEDDTLVHAGAARFEAFSPSDRQRAEHEGPRGGRRYRLPQEHCVR